MTPGERFEKEQREIKEEIARHQWLESEKAGKNIGVRARVDWIVNMFPKWIAHKRAEARRKEVK